MKRYGKSLLALLTVLLLTTVLLLPVLAETADAGGDLMLFDSEATVNDAVGGDLLAFAAELTVRGEVQGSIRAFASIMTLEGTVRRNVTVAAGSVECNESFSAGDVILLGDSVAFYGECDTLSITGGTVVIGGTVHGALKCSANEIILLESASFQTAQMTASSEPVVAASVNDRSGRALSDSAFADRVSFQKTESQLVRDLRSLPFTALMSVVLALVISFLFGRTADRLTLRFRTRPVPFCVKGLAALVLTPIAMILLVLPLVTLPVSGALLLVYLLLWLVADALTAAVLGRLWLSRRNPHLSTALIAAILAVLSVIPYIGGLISFFCLLVGFGSAVSLLLTRQEPQQNVPSEMDFTV